MAVRRKLLRDCRTHGIPRRRHPKTNSSRDRLRLGVAVFLSKGGTFLAVAVLCCCLLPRSASGADEELPTARASPLSSPDHRSRVAHARRLDSRPPVSQELEGLITHPDGRILGHLLWDSPDSASNGKEIKNPSNHKEKMKWRIPPRTSSGGSHYHSAPINQHRAGSPHGWILPSEQPSSGNRDPGGRIDFISSPSPAPEIETGRVTNPSAIAPPYIQEADQSRGGIAPIIRDYSGDHHRQKYIASASSPKPPHKLPPISSAAFMNLKQNQGSKSLLPHWVTRDIIPRIKGMGVTETGTTSTASSSDVSDVPVTTYASPNRDEPSASSTEASPSTSSNPGDDDASLIQLLEEALDFLEDYPQYIDELDLDALYDYLTNDSDTASYSKTSEDVPSSAGISTSQSPVTEKWTSTSSPEPVDTSSTSSPASTSAESTNAETSSPATVSTTEFPDAAMDVFSLRPIELPRLEDLFSIKTDVEMMGSFETQTTTPETSQKVSETSVAASTSTTTATEASSTSTKTVTTTTTTTPRSTTKAETTSSSTPRLQEADIDTRQPKRYNPLRPTRAPNVAVLIQSSKAKTPEEIRKLVEMYTNPKKLGSGKDEKVVTNPDPNDSRTSDSPAEEKGDEQSSPVTVIRTSTTTTAKSTQSSSIQSSSTAAGGAGLVWPRGNRRGKPVASTEAPSTAIPISFDDFLAKFNVKEAPVRELLPPQMPKSTTLASSSSATPVATSSKQAEPVRPTSSEPTGPPKSLLDLNPWLFAGQPGSSSTAKPWKTSTRSASTRPDNPVQNKGLERMLGDLMNDRSNQNLWTTRLGRPKQNQNNGFAFDSLSSAAGEGDSVLSFSKNDGIDPSSAQPDRDLVIDTFSEAVNPEEDDLLLETAVVDNGSVAASAIIASTVIGSVAAIFFISLFVFCKWRQYKQIRRNTRMPMPGFGRSRSRRQSSRSYTRSSPYYTSNNFWTLFGKMRHTETFHSVSGFSDSS